LGFFSGFSSRYFLSFAERQHLAALGTVEYHGNTEITETVIFGKCRDFAKML